MLNIRKGSIHLFRFAGIDLFLHWSWFLLVLFEIDYRGRTYSSIAVSALEFLALFVIVTIHEFGHALACRQVGGTSDQIVLWPLGGVAYVNPPQRPGAQLWSIAAGPLVNVALFPIFSILVLVSRSLGWKQAIPNTYEFLWTVWVINVGLLIFNMLPIYPLDGGQILRSLLWFKLGRARSLMAATIVGFVGVAGLIALAVWQQSAWIGILTAFILMTCWNGMQQALTLMRLAKLPRREGVACPSCQTAPLMGPYWICGRCRNSFDAFQSQGVCPSCGAQFAGTRCLECGRMYPLSEWFHSALAFPKV